MNRGEFVKAIVGKLRELGYRKPVRTPKHVFHISDDHGTTRNFVVAQTDRTEMFTQDDVENFLEALVDVVKESLSRADPVRIRGFGTFGLKWRNSRFVNHPNGQRIEIPGSYIPVFVFSEEFRILGKLYGITVDELISRQEKDQFTEDDEDLEDGDV